MKFFFTNAGHPPTKITYTQAKLLSYLLAFYKLIEQQIQAAGNSPEENNAFGEGGNGLNTPGAGKTGSDDEDETPENNLTSAQQSEKEIGETDAGEGTILNNIGINKANPQTDPEDIDLSSGTHEADAASG